MALYFGDAEVVIDGEVVTAVRVTIDDDPEGYWGGDVGGPHGQFHPPGPIEEHNEWLLRLGDGRAVEVSTQGYGLVTGRLDPWHTRFDGIGALPA